MGADIEIGAPLPSSARGCATSPQLRRCDHPDLLALERGGRRQKRAQAEL